MIKSITTYGKHIYANTIGSMPYLNQSYTSQGLAGTIRYNSSSQQTEVYDGLSWHVINVTTSISMSHTAESAIDWAIKKQAEELQLKEKMEKYPTLKEAFDQFKMIEALVYENDSKETV